MAPLGRVSEDGVDVAEVQQRRSLAVTVEGRDQVRSLIAGSEQLGLEAGRLQVLGQVLDRGSLVAGRVDGVEPDQPLKDGCRLLLKLGRHLLAA